MAREFANEPDAQRYALYLDGELASVVDYSVNGKSISFHRTYTSPTHRGKHLAAQVVEFAVNDVAEHTDFHIVPMCWYVGDWFDRHPERGALLTR